MLAYIAALFVIVAIYVIRYYQNVRKYPPGPTPLPIVGNMTQLPWYNLHIEVAKLRKQHGPVFTVWQPHPVVWILDLEHIKEALVTNGDSTLGRPRMFPESLIQKFENGGIIFSMGPQWKDERRTSLHILRDFGMGKNIMEEQVQISVQECVEHIRSIKDKKHLDMRWPIQLLVGNVINRLLFGYHYKYNDCERLQRFCDQLNWIATGPRANMLSMMSDNLTWIRKLPIIGHYAYGQFIETRDKMYEHLAEDIQRVLANYNIDDEPETFTQAYVQRMKKAGTFDYDRLQNVCQDFFVAGSETTSTTLRWGCIFMAKYPNVQEKIREEIFNVLGRHQTVSMKDRARMPYTSAAVIELQRCANIVPFNVTHLATEDTMCGGYKIPAGTQIQASVHTVLATDPHFEQPEEYHPDRFLEKDGKTLIKHLVDRVVPFSMGKRMCAGEGLARMELFIGLVSILQNFRIKPPLNEPLDTTPVFGGIILPPTNFFEVEAL